MTLAHRVHHYGIADLEAAISWYRTHLGFEVEKRFILDDGRLEIVKMTTATGVRIELLCRASSGEGDRSNGADPAAPGAMHLCFHVPDVEQAARELRRNGVSLVQEPKVIEVAGEKNLWIADLEGNRIEFIEELTGEAAR